MKTKTFIYVFTVLSALSCVDKKEDISKKQDPKKQVGLDSKTTTSLFTLLNPINTGINFINKLTETADMNGFFYEYYYNGAGVSIADINNDGLKDILFISNLRKNKLYLNLGGLKFKDITKESGLSASTGFRTGVTNVDINHDGLMDFYISKSGKYKNPDKRRNELWVNQGIDDSGIPLFKEQAASYNLDSDMYSTQASFFDYDRDGDLDMFLINHYITPFKYSEVDQLIKQKGKLTGDRLFENVNGKFKDITQLAGLTNTNRLSYALGVSIGDVNNDGWPDVYVANDYEGKDYLYINNKNGTFTDIANTAMQHTSFYSMGTDVGDLNNDGWLDIITLDMMAEDNYTAKTSMSAMNTSKFESVVDRGLGYQYMYNTLQINNGTVAKNNFPVFSDVAQLAGIATTDWSWGPLIFDMDNDGLNDIFISNGIKKDFRNNDFILKQQRRKDSIKTTDRSAFIKEVLQEMPERKKQNYFFKNNGDLSFSNMNNKWVQDIPSSSNGTSYADLDNDGDLEIIVNNADDVSLIYKNNSREYDLGNYVKFKFKGSLKNPAGVGARVALIFSDNIQVKEFFYSRGFQSTVGNGLHFGLGQKDTIPTIKVTWPDGKEQILKNMVGNREITLDYKNAEPSNNNETKESLITFKTNGVLNNSITWKHKENTFDDFERELLLPHKMSRLGPALAVTDYNGDGLDDVFIGGAKGQAPVLYQQTTNGSFKPVQQSVFTNQSDYEDVNAYFFDMDQDGDEDLYIVSGGNESSVNSERYEDRIFENKSGTFQLVKKALPKIYVSGSIIVPFDYDGDNDLDIFVGGRQFPGRYPSPVSSYLLRNDSKPNEILFKEVSAKNFPDLKNLGMVTDAIAIDIDHNGAKDLIVVGEWMPIRLFLNNNNTFKDASSSFGFDNTTGWWNTIEAGDFDKDGDLDLVVGNLGLNYKYKASQEKSFNIYSDDFDDNGSFDIVLGYYQGNNIYPLRGRQCSSDQMPFIKKKFPSYDAFGKASLAQVYGNEKLDGAIKYKAKTFASTYFENTGKNNFKAKPLPNWAQKTSVNAIVLEDFNNDDHLDMLLAGNLYNSEVETPRNDSGFGTLLFGDGKGAFRSEKLLKTGLYINGEVKNIAKLKISNNRSALLVAKNNDSLQCLIWNNNDN